MDTQQKMKAFLDVSSYLNQVTVASLIGITAQSLSRWLNNKPLSPTAELLAEKFLTRDGKNLLEIQNSLRNGTGNRLALHQQRAEILKKARIQQTSNQLVSSLKVAV